MKNSKSSGKHTAKPIDKYVDDGLKNNSPVQKEHRGQDENLDPYVFNCAKYYALKLVRSNFYSFSDLEDLEQEILVNFIEKNRKYKPYSNISAKNWTTIIVKSSYKELMRKSKLRRKYFSNISLNEPINSNDDNGNSEIIDFIEDKNSSNAFEDFCQLKEMERLYKIIETLPEDLKKLCRLLQTKNVTEIAKELKLSRWSVYDKIHKIKRIFEKAGVGKL
jgi:RNA polymerase sigma factor (sigma-70 family)